LKNSLKNLLPQNNNSLNGDNLKFIKKKKSVIMELTTKVNLFIST